MRQSSLQSLRGLLRAHLGSLVLLVVVTAGLSGAWALVWRHSSQASLRLNGLLVEAQAVRGDLYRQMKEITRLDEMPSREDYWRRLYQIDEHFYLMEQYAETAAQHRAIARMHDAYELIGVVMNRLILTTNADPSESQIAKLLDPAYDRWVTGDFEQAYDDLTAIVAADRERLQARLDRWLALAPWISALPLLLALAVVVRVNRRFRSGFVQPMRELAAGAAELGRGGLVEPVPEKGVTELRQLARTLNRMARELAASRRELVERERQAALGALVPVIAHNIRNPLAGIRANAQLLDSEASADEILETGADIIDASDRLERWLGALLAYLHPLQIRAQPCDFDAVVDGAVAALGGRPQAQDVRLIRDRPPAPDRGLPGARLNADAPLLEQALHGLLANALEASPGGGAIRLTTTVRAGRARLSIEDQGPGMRIDPDPLAQGPLPTTKKRGTGLGIPFAYKVVHAHGGKIQFAAAAWGGTRVTIDLPLGRA